MPRPARRLFWDELVFAGAVASVSGLLVVPVLRLWRMDWAVPLDYSGDANLNAVAVRSVLDGGWGLFNRGLAAPFGQRLHDFPFADNLSLATIRLLGVVWSGPARATNVFFLLTFPLTAAVAVLVLRRLGISRLAAAVGGVLYAFLPFHFLRGEQHLFLASYWTVPIGCYLALSVLSGRPRFGSRRATAQTVIACVVVGLSVQYFALFSMLLVAVALGLRMARGFDRRVALGGVAVLLLLLGTFVVSLTPTLVERWRHGPNRAVGQRTLAESEIYGLTLAHLVLPVAHHRLTPFAHARERYESSAVVESERSAAALGVFASAGLAYLIVVALARVVGRSGDAMDGHLAALAVAAFLFATAGGGSTLLGLGFARLRAWNRMSIFIAFFAVAASARLLDRFGRALSRRADRVPIFVMVCAAIVVLGLLDQTTTQFVPDYRATAQAFRVDQHFAGEIERSLPSGAAVYQLPYVPFPEEVPPERMVDYDLARPFLHTSRVRWSYGAMKGRPADWAAELADLPVANLVPRLAAAGFDGVYVDRFGYSDDAVALEAQLRATMQVSPRISPDHRVSFFDLRPYAARLRRSHPRSELLTVRQATLFPVRLEWGSGFASGSGRGDLRQRSARDARAELRLVNPSSSARDVTLEATLEGPPGRLAELTIAWGDGGASEHVTARPGGTRVRHRLKLAPGSTPVVFRVESAPGVEPQAAARVKPTLYLRVHDVVVTDAAAGLVG
jgi:phosphoglycerol transferase